MFVRMVIGEVLSDDQMKEFLAHANRAEAINEYPGYQGIQVMREEGGNMVVVITSWTTRNDALAYHSSRQYRQFVAKTQHLLVGQVIVKLFQMD